MTRRFIASQAVLLAVFGLILLVGNRSQPKLALADATPPVNGALVITLDRPVDRASLERSLRVRDPDGTPLKGAFSWSSRSVAFTPAAPLRADTAYTLTVDTVVDRQGNRLRRPWTATARTRPARFVYLTGDKQLRLYDTAAGRAVDVSAGGHVVQDYAVDPTGTRLLYAYQEAAGRERYGLAQVAITGTTISDRRVLYAGADRQTTRVLWCNAGGTVLLADVSLVRGETTVWSVPAYEGELALAERQPWLPEGEGALYSSVSASVECSATTSSVVYKDLQGRMLLRPVFGGSAVELGFQLDIFGFTPLTGRPMFSERADAIPGSLTRASTIVDPLDGSRIRVAPRATDTSDLDVDATEAWGVVAEDDRLQDDGLNHSRIAAYRLRDNTRLAISEPVMDAWDDHPTWSPDARLVAYARHPLAAPPGGRTTNSQGDLLDGDIYLATTTVSGDDDRALTGPPLTLGIRGGSLTWLP